MLVDCHCHLEHEKFKNDLDEVINRCRRNNIIAITCGVNKSTNRQALLLGEKYKDILRVSLGLYPLDALEKEIEQGEFLRDIEKTDVEEELKFIESKKDKIIAVGEAGLDFKFSDKKEEQKTVFQKVIELCERINKPLIVHSRKAEKEAVEMLESSNIKKIVMHCFNGNFKLVKRIEDNGWFLSIPVIILRSLHFQGIVNMVNINQLLTETDSPYLAPPPKMRNEPIYVKKTIEKIAEIKNMDEKETENNIFMNYQNLFLK